MGCCGSRARWPSGCPHPRPLLISPWEGERWLLAGEGTVVLPRTTAVIPADAGIQRRLN